LFPVALEWLYTYQKKFTTKSPANYVNEMKGVVDAICSTDKHKNSLQCKTGGLHRTVVGTNEIADLVKMQCSMMGAWGEATANGDLVQYRTLDFGGGPFANRTFLHIAHPTDSDFEFASYTFPGFVGAVTGFTKNIAQSEIGYCLPKGHIPKGTYNGENDAFAIRDILQFAKSSDHAVEIAEAASRTWGIFLGFGDYNTKKFDMILYDEETVQPLTYQNTTTLTSQKVVKDVAYIDKHCQPSHDDTITKVIESQYGNITAEIVAQYFPHEMKSGDVHTAVYDFTSKDTYLSHGITDADGHYISDAYAQPFLKFNNDDLWNEPAPSQTASFPDIEHDIDLG